MKIQLNNNNLNETRQFLMDNNIKPNSELSYYLSFGFDNDTDIYVFYVVETIKVIKKSFYVIQE